MEDYNHYDVISWSVPCERAPHYRVYASHVIMNTFLGITESTHTHLVQCLPHTVDIHVQMCVSA